MPDLSNLLAHLDGFAKSLSADQLVLLGGGGVAMIALSLIMLVRGGSKGPKLGEKATQARLATKRKGDKSDPFVNRLERLSVANA